MGQSCESLLMLTDQVSPHISRMMTDIALFLLRQRLVSWPEDQVNKGI